MTVKKHKVPRANASPEAIRLRKAATAFGKNVDEDPEDPEDKKGQRLNRELLKAAIAYARRAKGHKTKNVVFHRATYTHRPDYCCNKCDARNPRDCTCIPYV